ncbi:phage integrase SAM-like domain-containing protein [Ornithinibacillus salinisoli]|uniref:phage integrase SAM-like domain-containing protein n=1 Tax=Ornithinibacillus salinisoli TaxID=1848459 RepID=UPI003671FF00
MTFIPQVSLTTLKHYEYSLRAVNEYFLDTPIKNIKRHDYQKFLNWFGSNKAKETVAKVHGHVKSCVKDAMEDQLIQIDFTKKLNQHGQYIQDPYSNPHALQ